MPESTARRFTSTIMRSGSRTYVVIPFYPDEAWGVKEHHHVRGTINASMVRGMLRSDGKQVYLTLGPVWLRDAGVEVGASVDVELVPEGPQHETLAPDIVAALDAEPEAKRFFESLATYYRNGYMRWIDGNKRPEIRQSRIAEVIGLLNAGKKQR